MALLLAATAQPLLAACGDFATLGTNAGPDGKSGIWTAAGQWTAPSYYAGYLPFTYEPPVSPNFAGKFWALGTGNPLPGAGDDSNTWDASNWFYFYGPGGYGSFFAGEVFTGWGGSAQIDGCVPLGGCTCMLLTDEIGGVTYSALLSAQADATNSTFFNQPGTDGAGNGGPIMLMPLATPQIVTTVKNGIGVDVTVNVPPVTAGIYQKDGCDCSGSRTYEIWAKELIEGSAPPVDRTTDGWTLLSGGNALGTSATAFAPCDTATGVDLYIATRVVDDPASGGGFGSDTVSDISSRIVCGSNPTLADPDQPRIKPNRPVKPRRTKG
jgi:hypothetical protein